MTNIQEKLDFFRKHFPECNSISDKELLEHLERLEKFFEEGKK